MKHIAFGAAMAVVAVTLVISGPRDALADEGGSDFCIGGFFWVPAATVAFVPVLGIPYVTGEHWACGSDEQ